MPEYQQRVIDEHKELSERHAKLLAFFNTDTFRGLSCAEKTLLSSQCLFMDGYKNILELRIAAFA